jgi:hypothetical protein
LLDVLRRPGYYRRAKRNDGSGKLDAPHGLSAPGEKRRKSMTTFETEMLAIAEKYEDLSAFDQRMAKLIPEEAAEYTRRALEHQMRAEKIRADIAIDATCQR